MCGSDVHTPSGNWGRPYVPGTVGHEIIGTIVKIVPKAKPSLKIGDRVAVGAQCDCNGTCSACKDHTEQYVKIRWEHTLPLTRSLDSIRSVGTLHIFVSIPSLP